MVAKASLAQFPPLIDLSDSTANITIYGAHSADRTGFGFTTGDYDGDGLNDLAILSSSSLVDDTTGAFIHIFWARSPQDTMIDLFSYHGDVSKILAPPGEDAFWLAQITSGDFNHDGYDDIALGIPEESITLNEDGKAYIIFGSPSFPDTLRLEDPTSPVTTIWPIPGSWGWMGSMLATGDVNGDRYIDLIIGAQGIYPGGQVYVIYGRKSFPSDIFLASSQPDLTRIIEYYLYQATGGGLACKDVNNDGFDDLLIGSPGFASCCYEGRVTLLFGSDALPDTIVLSRSTIKAMGMKQFYGEYTHGQLGWRVAIGDIDGNKVEDLILSALMADPLGCRDCGEIYIIPWYPSLPDSIDVGSTSDPMWRLIGGGAIGEYGRRLVAADVTGDGITDILMTSRPDDYNPQDVGKVTVVYGSTNLPDTVFLATDTLVTRFLGEGRQDDFGRGLGVGDVNNDGIMDALIGANNASPLGRGAAGIAYVFYGINKTPEVPPVFAFMLFQNYPNPFSSSTTIEYSLPHSSLATLTIYNVLGQRIARLIDPEASKGMNFFRWDGRNARGQRVASGLYLYRVEAGGVARTKKMILLR